MAEYQGPERRHIDRWRWRLLALWIIVFSGAIIWIYHDLQKSRKEACQRTFRSLDEIIIRAYTPPPGVHLDPRLRGDRRALLVIASPNKCNIISTFP